MKPPGAMLVLADPTMFSLRHLVRRRPDSFLSGANASQADEVANFALNYRSPLFSLLREVEEQLSSGQCNKILTY